MEAAHTTEDARARRPGRPRRWLLAVAVPVLAAVVAAHGAPARLDATPAPTDDDGQRRLVELVRQAATPLAGRPDDYDRLVARIGDADIVMLGESTHGTHEFYRERSRITERLIRDEGFTAMAIEGEWADARRVHRFIAGQGTDRTAAAALSGFDRFPRWMWANAEIRDLVGRLRRARTEAGRGAGAVGFYGLDVQEPGPAMAAVVRHLRAIDPRAAEQARRRYACLTGLGEVTAGVGAAARPPSCRRGVRAQWRELVRRQQQADPRTERGEAAFAAAQSARVVMNAEEYFSGDIGGALSAWSLRDRHMADTLDAIRAHLRRQGRSPKVVVWAHNTHVGDARASTLGQGGDLSVGQLMRRRHPAETVLVGFTTYAGSVVAASDWGAPGRAQELRPARPESHAGIFHRTGIGDFVLPLPARGPLAEELSEPRPERAVGVVYLPASEAASHYLTARLARHFDAVVHIDASRGVTPLPG